MVDLRYLNFLSTYLHSHSHFTLPNALLLTQLNTSTVMIWRFISIPLTVLFISFTDISYLKLATKKILENITPDAAMINTVRSLLSDPECSELVAIIGHVKSLSLNIEAESIDEDPNWFEGVSGNQKTKELVLKKSARERVRSYFYSSKDFIDNSVCALCIL